MKHISLIHYIITILRIKKMSYQIDIEKDKILLSVWRNDKPFINKEF